MSARIQGILARFPAHLEAKRPGKLLGTVARGLGANLSRLSSDVAGVRRAHRVGHASTLRDLYLLGDLHGLGRGDLGAVPRRSERHRALAAALAAAVDAGDPGARDAAAHTIARLWGLDDPASLLALVGGSSDGAMDLDAAARSLAEHLRRSGSHPSLLAAIRRRIRVACRVHRVGNGTLEALIETAASSLDLVVDQTRNRSFASTQRPVVQIATEGTPGRRTWIYVVVARPTWRQDARPSPPVVLATGPATLSAADRIRLSWESVAGARDYLVYRIKSGGQPSSVGLITPTPLPPGTLELEDTGLPAAGDPLPETGDPLFRSRDGFWHASFVRERAPLRGELGSRLPSRLPPDVIGIEENPRRREQTPPLRVQHAERFVVYRRGFDRVGLEASVTGIHNHTVGPMVVNRDEGRGVGFAGHVPAGETLVFRDDGQVFLSESRVTTHAFFWEGACFAGDDDDPRAPRDFVFDGPGAPDERRAYFAVGTPRGALDPDFAFPHSDPSLPILGVGIGKTRFAFFVQEAHHRGAPKSLNARPKVGFLDGSVFAPGSAEVRPDAAVVSLAWQEHEAYALRALLPARFAHYDVASGGGADQPTLAERVRTALERVRPVGVDVRVAYQDDAWTLGSSALGGGGFDPIAILMGDTMLTTPEPPFEA